MAETTAIAWTRSTFNPWIGCTEVSIAENGGGGCDACYARELDKRHRYGGATHWGTGVPRFRTSEAYWKKALTWNALAKLEGEHGIDWQGRRAFYPVFPSMCDPFDNEVDEDWHADFWRLIRATPFLTWLLLTKRIGNVEKMHPGGDYHNVWIGASIVNQKEADRDIPKLLAVTGFMKRFVSYEPALGRVFWPGFNAGTSWCPICKAVVTDSLNDFHENQHGVSLKDPFDPKRHTAFVYDLIHQVIVGGESSQGPHRGRPFNIAWARDTRDQCRAAGVPFFMKQFGAMPYERAVDDDGGGCLSIHPPTRIPLKDRSGSDPAEWPQDLRVQEFPL